ncbi:hypothetical protein QYE76_063482 [Lolium multiflorum]|uniref:Uncharacterized protein n=1 Tax=Lolium multiflorum TaxID=4521 RepID=A0AAD8W9C7_LOLMU|nr:hypothetical protein QYE76_063482 [Lolium multiflorum]
MNAPTACTAWQILQRMFSSWSRAQIIQIRSHLTSAKKKGVSAADYFRNMKMLVDTLAAIVQPPQEEEVISYILAGLGPNYDSLVTSLRVKDDLTLDEIYSHLLAYEHRHEIQDDEYTIDGGSSANFTSRNQGSGNGGHPGGRGNGGRGGGNSGNDGNRGRGGGNGGRGGGGNGGSNHGNGGRGNGGRSQGCGGHSGGTGGLRPVCQICNMVGHIALCWYSRFDHAYGGEEEHYFANHASTSYQMDPSWYMNSGATDHITGDLERLHMRDGSGATDHITGDLERLRMRDGYNGNDRVQVGNGTGSPAAGVPGDHIDHVPQPPHAGPSADSDAAHVGSDSSTPNTSAHEAASPSSSPAPSSLSSSTSSQVVIVPPAPHREHRMQTCLRAGKTLPIQRTNGRVTYYVARVVDGEPSSVRAALQTPAWKAAMDVEYSALQRNQT